MPETPASLRPLKFGYAESAAAGWLARRDVLAVIGFNGADDTDDPRSLRVALDPLIAPAVEVWIAGGPVRSGRAGSIRWSSDGDYSFVAIEIDERAHDGISGAAEQAYRELVAFIAASATPNILRIWNYLDAINLGDGDDERYRHFCVGRARGIRDVPRGGYPAATAIGRRDGSRMLQVYALAARVAGAPIENPRQTSAWRYPREYGPTPPTFARGMMTPAGQVLISGTAAVVGSASQHRNDAVAQLDETLKNISTLIGSARSGASAQLGPGSLLKVYVRHREDAPLIVETLRRRIPALDGLLLLEGDICRRELLLEIDGLHA